MSSILRSVAEKSIIHQVPDITRAFLVQTGGRMNLKTEGINILVRCKTYVTCIKQCIDY